MVCLYLNGGEEVRDEGDEERCVCIALGHNVVELVSRTHSDQSMERRHTQH